MSDPDTRHATPPSRRQLLKSLAAWPALAAVSALYGTTAGAQTAPQAAAPDFWALAREGGNIFLMRHATTVPGIGDPPNFTLGNCATQRNLSEAGRAESRRVGERFRAEGVQLDSVRASAWCRCVDTAQEAFGRHEVWAPINSFFQERSTAEAQTAQVMAAVRQRPPRHNWMLVTHQVNVSALTGSFTSMGEILLTRPGPDAGRLQVLARWRP
jgi:phosphohistidine phosphatase SixA